MIVLFIYGNYSVLFIYSTYQFVLCYLFYLRKDNMQ